jgi:hypothetical protein
MKIYPTTAFGFDSNRGEAYTLTDRNGTLTLFEGCAEIKGITFGNDKFPEPEILQF